MYYKGFVKIILQIPFFTQLLCFIIFIGLGECVVISKVFSRLTNSNFYKGVQKNVRRFEQGALDLLPDATFNKKKTIGLIGDIGRDISSAENRLILGVSALMSQPFIDAKNKDVDEKTRKVSVCRTIAKIVAGTLTGYLIRKGCISAIKNWSQLPGKGVPRYKSLFTPKGARSTNSEAFKQYQNAMGTVVALVVMLFTNFGIDAPFTKFLTNLLVKKTGGDK